MLGVTEKNMKSLDFNVIYASGYIVHKMKVKD